MYTFRNHLAESRQSAVMLSTMDQSTPPNSEAPSPDAFPDASALQDRTPDWCRMSRASTVFLLGLELILVLLFGSRPLWHSDLWDHINYGRHILETRSVSTTEPLLPLAEGMPLVNTAWAVQAAMAAIFRTDHLGLPALQFMHGLLAVTALGVIGWAVWRRSGSVVCGIMGYVVFLALNWQQFLVIRPQLVGVTLYSALLAVLVVDGCRRKAAWLLLPLTFALWANLHGSFAMGLTLLGLFTIGRFVDTGVKTRSLRKAMCSRSAWRMVLLIQLCAAAVLLNPNGIAIYAEVLRVGSHPNIASMFEWDPLTLRMKQGQIAAVVGVLLLLVLRVSPRRLRADETLALLTTAGLALWSSRMINWCAPVAAVVLTTHGAAAWRLWRKSSRRSVRDHRRGLWTVANLGLLWICFGFTSLGVHTIHGKSPDPRRLLSRQTPIEAGRYLAKKSDIPPGIVFVRAEWAGYLTHVRNGDLRSMVNLHVHVIPVQVWSDYLRLIDGPNDWDSLLDRYGINCVIADRTRNARLIALLRRSSDYAVQYEDAQTAVFVRKERIR